MEQLQQNSGAQSALPTESTCDIAFEGAHTPRACFLRAVFCHAQDKPFWLKPFCSNLPLLARGRQVFSSSLLLHPLQTWQLMPRKGWTALETPNGWFKLIRGPRPPSVRWPSAKSSVPGTSKQNSTPPRGRWRQERSRVTPEDAWESAKKRAPGLEAATSAMVAPEVTSLKESLGEGQNRMPKSPVCQYESKGRRSSSSELGSVWLLTMTHMQFWRRSWSTAKPECNVWRQKPLWCFLQGRQCWMPRFLRGRRGLQ